MSRANVLLFGRTGAGKSSVVNMLSNSEHAAPTSSGARGCTFQSTPYNTEVLDTPVKLWDTAGLDEGDAGRVPKTEAIINLYNLLRNLAGGVNLLVFVMRGPRIMDTDKENWLFFQETVCQRRVPAVIVITGLEAEENMNAWWHENKGAFHDYGILPAGFACITATRGKPLRNGAGYKFDEEYEESQVRVKELIKSTCYEPGKGWSMPPAQWFETVVEVTWKSKSRGAERVETSRTVETQAFNDMKNGLMKTCGISEGEARKIMKKLE